MRSDGFGGRNAARTNSGGAQPGWVFGAALSQILGRSSSVMHGASPAGSALFEWCFVRRDGVSIVVGVGDNSDLRGERFLGELP